MDGKTPETGEKKKSLLIFSCICAVGICVLIAYIVNILTPLDRILDYSRPGKGTGGRRSGNYLSVPVEGP